jgi:hypothetical protein
VHTRFCSGDLRERDHWEYLSADEKNNIKMDLQKVGCGH